MDSLCNGLSWLHFKCREQSVCYKLLFTLQYKNHVNVAVSTLTAFLLQFLGPYRLNVSPLELPYFVSKKSQILFHSLLHS